MKISLSDIDKKRFGITVAIAQDIAMDDIEATEHFCIDNHVEMCITRVATTDLQVIQKLEDIGYRLMDTLVYYAFKFNKKVIPDDTNDHYIRPAQANDAESVVDIATASFKGYFGHYHADPRLPNDKCDEVYIDWAEKSVRSREITDAVLIVENDGQLNGFATMRQLSEADGEGVLFGVAPHAQGQGIYRTMMIHGMRWCKQQGLSRMLVSTQITNIAVQKVWARLGFEMNHGYYTLHKWF
ncbi:MAG: GNAT family N-acetyltransferase [Chloroflexota bacterium]